MITENGNDAFFAAIRLRKKTLVFRTKFKSTNTFYNTRKLTTLCFDVRNFFDKLYKIFIYRDLKKKKKVCNDVRHSVSNRNIFSII